MHSQGPHHDFGIGAHVGNARRSLSALQIAVTAVPDGRHVSVIDQIGARFGERSGHVALFEPAANQFGNYQQDVDQRRLLRIESHGAGHVEIEARTERECHEQEQSGKRYVGKELHEGLRQEVVQKSQRWNALVYILTKQTVAVDNGEQVGETTFPASGPVGNFLVAIVVAPKRECCGGGGGGCGCCCCCYRRAVR